MKKKQRTRSRSKTEKREDEPPEGPIIILEPRGPGQALIWLKTMQKGSAQLGVSSQPANGSLRADFIGMSVISFDVNYGNGWHATDEIRAATMNGDRSLRVRNQGRSLPLVWQLTQGNPPMSTTLAPTGAFNSAEVPFDFSGFDTLWYLSGQSWINCLSFRFQVSYP